MRRAAFLLAVTITVANASTSGEATARQNAIEEFFETCEQYGDTDVVLVGRAESPVTYRIYDEAEIEKARQNLIATEQNVALLKNSLDPREQPERYLQAESWLAEARAEFEMIRSGLYYELTFFPIIVEQALRGVTESILMLRLSPSRSVEPGELYLISGFRSRENASMPERRGLPFVEYVDGAAVTRVGAAKRELQFLTATGQAAAIVGELRRQSYGDISGAPLPGVRILVSSPTETLETVTQEDGSFIVSGIEPGPVDVTPVLPRNLGVVNRSALTFTFRDRWCKQLGIGVDLNGQIRGRVLGATDRSLDGAELTLRSVREGDFNRWSSHDVRRSTRPHQDGSFEFSGVPPGTYLLTAVIQKTENGKPRYLVTYFPGTSDLAAAVPIVVGNATQHDGIDFLVTTE